MDRKIKRLRDNLKFMHFVFQVPFFRHFHFLKWEYLLISKNLMTVRNLLI